MKKYKKKTATQKTQLYKKIENKIIKENES